MGYPMWGMGREIKKRSGDVSEEAPTPKRDKVAEWRLERCIAIVGFDHGPEFAASTCDLHRLEALAQAGCPLPLLRGILLD
jgi:hypothetical protein